MPAIKSQMLAHIYEVACFFRRRRLYPNSDGLSLDEEIYTAEAGVYTAILKNQFVKI